MKHVVSISDLSKKQILSVLKRAKELVPVAKGKKKYDKRQVQKERDWNRQKARLLREQ